jgi:opacity protein-like surface antigen
MKLQISAALAATLTAGLLAASPSSFAAAPGSGLYIGGGVGYNRFEGEEFPSDQDQVQDLEDERVSYKGIVGLQMSPYFALEGQYIQFGDFEDGPLSIDVSGLTASGLVILPFTSNVSAYGKAGVLFWDVDLDFEQGGQRDSFSDDGNDFTYGLGLRLALSQALVLRLEYERFALEDNDVDTASANLLFHF